MRIILSQTDFIDNPSFTPEENNGPFVTDDTGYVPPDALIRNLTKAGTLLQHQRNIESAYQYPADSKVDVDEMEIDPTLRPGFDAIDAQVISASLRHKYASAMAEAEQAKLEQQAIDNTTENAEPADAATEIKG